MTVGRTMRRNSPPNPAAARAAASALSIILLVLFTGVAAWADRLELRNDDVITGTIQLMDAEKIVVQTEYGLLEVQRDAVLRGEFGVDDGKVVDSLLFRFDFDGTMDDATGTNRATNNGLRFVTDRNGSPASAVRSDGNGTYLSIPPSVELNELDQFTLSFWIQLEELSSTQYLFSKWNRADGETADGKMTVQTGGGNLTLYVVDPSGVYHWLTARSVLQAMTWHAVAVTYAGGRAAIYVDGALAASERLDFTGLFTDSSPVLVMTAESRTEDPFSYYNSVGTIDDLRLYSRALSPAEVESLALESGTE